MGDCAGRWMTNHSNEASPGKMLGGKNRGVDGQRARAVRTRKPPRLLDQLRQALRRRHYSRKAEQSYSHWVKRFIMFHGMRHPNELAEDEINAFLSDLALKRKVSASTQTQALSAVLFLYRRVLKWSAFASESKTSISGPIRLSYVAAKDPRTGLLCYRRPSRGHSFVTWSASGRPMRKTSEKAMAV